MDGGSSVIRLQLADSNQAVYRERYRGPMAYAVGEA